MVRPPLAFKVHTLPTRPSDINDDGYFHYAVQRPNASSDSGKPSSEAIRYLDETTGPDKPRVYRNALILLAPSRDGLNIASTNVRNYLAWDQVRVDLKEQHEDGNVDIARMQTLTMSLDKSKRRISNSIRQAYSTVVTVSSNDDVCAFKINVTDEPHFEIIKNDKRSRIVDSPIAPEALLPDGPYNLWREGETNRHVKDLSGAFAQMPHLPKMLKAQTILNTLVEGCERGTFVLRLFRPDGSYRTWWHAQPDYTSMTASALELVLPKAAELQEINFSLILPDELPELWQGNTLTIENLENYFDGNKVVQIQKKEYMQPMSIPYASKKVIHATVNQVVEHGRLWLTNGPASVLAETDPSGCSYGPGKTPDATSNNSGCGNSARKLAKRLDRRKRSYSSLYCNCLEPEIWTNSSLEDYQRCDFYLFERSIHIS